MRHRAPDSTPEDLSDNLVAAEFDYTVRADGKRTGLEETFWLDINDDGLLDTGDLRTFVELYIAGC